MSHENENPRRQPGVNKTEHFTSNDTPPSLAAQYPHGGISTRFEVRTQKASGTVFLFQAYATPGEAEAVAKRLIEIGGNAHVVEVAS